MEEEEEEEEEEEKEALPLPLLLAVVVVVVVGGRGTVRRTPQLVLGQRRATCREGVWGTREQRGERWPTRAPPLALMERLIRGGVGGLLRREQQGSQQQQQQQQQQQRWTKQHR